MRQRKFAGQRPTSYRCATQPTACVCIGLRNRANGSNTVNEHSSRSHSVLTLNIDSEIYDEEDDKLCMTRHGKLAFVDLAGACV